MLLSIVVPLYNVEAYVHRCLSSILSQTGISEDVFELIIVDDGSPDTSADIARADIAGIANARLISQDNLGLGGARNTGLRNASGDYVWFVDSDDWIVPGALQQLIDIISTTRADYISICGVSDNNPQINRLPDTASTLTVFMHDWSNCAQFFVMSRQFLLDNNLWFKEHLLHEDADFTPRMLFLAKSCMVSNLPLYQVFANPTSITRSLNPAKSFDLVTVIDNLHDFFTGQPLDASLRTRVCDFISLILNNSLHNIMDFDGNTTHRLNHRILQSHHHIIHCLKASSITKYRLEGYLFALFPGRYTNIYRILKMRF